MGAPVFILGAGSSLAANCQYDSSHERFAKRYPLTSDLGVECFGSSWHQAGGVEAAFDAAILAGDREPIAKLVKLIQTADYYLGWAEAKDSRSIYGQLLRRFPDAQFVSFNYDSLLEQVLLQRGLWNPRDGFGVTVETGNSPIESQRDPSKAIVLHLHGSVLLYPAEFSWDSQGLGDRTLWVKPRKEPKFLFDPDNLGHCFSPFSRAQPDLSYRHPEQRIIVPLPNKSKALRESYVQVVYARANQLLRTADQVIAVGYSFAECDRSSFQPLLQTVVQNEKPLWVVGPHANGISTTLLELYPPLLVNPVPATLEEWAESGFQGP